MFQKLYQTRLTSWVNSHPGARVKQVWLRSQELPESLNFMPCWATRLSLLLELCDCIWSIWHENKDWKKIRTTPWFGWYSLTIVEFFFIFATHASSPPKSQPKSGEIYRYWLEPGCCRLGLHSCGYVPIHDPPQILYPKLKSGICYVSFNIINSTHVNHFRWSEIWLSLLHGMNNLVWTLHHRKWVPHHLSKRLVP